MTSNIYVQCDNCERELKAEVLRDEKDRPCQVIVKACPSCQQEHDDASFDQGHAQGVYDTEVTLGARGSLLVRLKLALSIIMKGRRNDPASRTSDTDTTH